MTLSRLLALSAILPLAAALPASPARPFPQHTTYTAGTLKPAAANAAALDAPVRAFFDIWKGKYLLTANPDAPAVEQQRYVYYNLEGVGGAGNLRSISEGHGYGMLATAFMAGHDPAAQTDFDALYRFFRAHPSVFNSDLMAWKQAGKKFKDIEGGDSATDGDLDIAYALLLADKQWGSAGPIDYHAEALKVIAAIKLDEVNPELNTIKLGDFTTPGDHYYNGTRSSDFMLQHWQSFRDATGDAAWGALRDKTYEILASVFADYAPNTGLMPDFIVVKSSGPRPAPPFYLEGSRDGQWYYNACRTPWRVALDYLINGDPRAFAQLQALNAWITQKTHGDPAKINGGYKLKGKRLKLDSGACFNAPLAVSAMVGAPNQPWLDAVWIDLLARNPDTQDDYFSNSVKLLCMVVISGNWWEP